MEKEPVRRGFELPPLEEKIEREEERGLRPLELADFNGQSEIKAKLAICIQAAKKREEALDHILFYGPPGLGKTTLAGIIATSLLTLLILVFTFWYLIHTLLKQKTLDEMKSDFTHNITHELKTPIAVAYAANDALLNFNKWEDVETREKYLRVSQEQLQQLSGMVEQILSMSVERQKDFVLKLEVLNMKEIVAAAVETQKMKNGKPLHISIAIQPDDLTLTADRTLLLQMLDNLLDNAVKYSMSEVYINICGGITRDEITFISVSDHGIGLTPEQQRHIFEKFYRVPNGNLHDVKGHGLGLYYVATMMKLHRGSVYVNSKPGEGSTFILHFPTPNTHTLNLLAWLMGGMLIPFL